MNRSIQAIAEALLIGAVLLGIVLFAITGRVPRPGPRTAIALAIVFLLVITPKR